MCPKPDTLSRYHVPEGEGLALVGAALGQLWNHPAVSPSVIYCMGYIIDYKYMVYNRL